MFGIENAPPCLNAAIGKSSSNDSDVIFSACVRAKNACPLRMKKEKGEGETYFAYLFKANHFLDATSLDDLQEKLTQSLDLSRSEIKEVCSACVNQIEKLLLEDLGLTGKSDKSQNCDHGKLWV